MKLSGQRRVSLTVSDLIKESIYSQLLTVLQICMPVSLHFNASYIGTEYREEREYQCRKFKTQGNRTHTIWQQNADLSFRSKNRTNTLDFTRILISFWQSRATGQSTGVSYQATKSSAVYAKYRDQRQLAYTGQNDNIPPSTETSLNLYHTTLM